MVEDGYGWRSSATPVLRGTGPVGYYDVAFKRFLPVSRAQVSPDGRRYVYMDYTTQGGLYAYGQIHVVDVSTGRDDVRWSTGKVPYEVWLVSRPATPEKVDAGVSANLQTDPWYRTGRVETSYSGLGISDSHGIWLGGDAIYLYQHGQGLTKVATFPGFPSNGCT